MILRDGLAPNVMTVSLIEHQNAATGVVSGEQGLYTG